MRNITIPFCVFLWAITGDGAGPKSNLDESSADDLAWQWSDDDEGIPPSFAEEAPLDKEGAEMQNNGFIQKEEITSFGYSEFVDKTSSAGGAFGIESIAGRYFISVIPELNLEFGKFAASIGAPLRFPMFEATRDNSGPLRFKGIPIGETIAMRKQDWDDPRDFFRFLRYVSWGQREDKYYGELGRVAPISLGHGALVRGYIPNINADLNNIFAQGKLDFKVAKLEAFVGPLLVPHFFGISASIFPLQSTANRVLQTLGVSIDYVGHIKAPTSLSTTRSGQNTLLAVSPQYHIEAQEGAIHGGTIGITATPLMAEMVELDTYANYSHLWFPAVTDAVLDINSERFSAGGFAIGTLFKLSLGSTEQSYAGLPSKPQHAFRLRVEGNAFSGQFLPGFFDSLYEVQQYEFGVSRAGGYRIGLPTKIGYLAGQKNSPVRIGLRGEVSYALVGWFGIGLQYEDAFNVASLNSDAAATNFAFHIESTELAIFQILATYQLRNLQNFRQVFDFRQANELLFLRGRVKVLPFLFINGWVQRTFDLGFSSSDKASNVGTADKMVSSVGIDNIWIFGTDVELAWQF